MLRRRHRILTVLGLAVATASFLTASSLARDKYGYGWGSAHGSLEWQGRQDASLASGLYLLDNSPYGVVHRVLVADANDAWLAVSTWTLDGSTGRDVQDLVDDKSGWSARAELRFGTEGESLGDFFQRTHADVTDDSLLELRLSTHKGVEEVRHLPAYDPDIWASFSRDLDLDQSSRLAHSIPADFRPAVIFLDLCMNNWLAGAGEGGPISEDQGLTNLHRFLADILRKTFPDEAETWAAQAEGCRLEKGRNTRGRGVVEPEMLALTSRFQSVENADPLAGHYVEEVTGPAAPQDPD